MYFLSIKPYTDEESQKEYPSVRLILSGGGKSDPEAHRMRDLAVKLGVNPDDCIIEDKSMNTIENILFSLNIITQLGYFKPTFCITNSFVICSSEFHIKRALLIGTHILSPHGRVEILSSPNENEEMKSQRSVEYIENMNRQRNMNETKLIMAYLSEMSKEREIKFESSM